MFLKLFKYDLRAVFKYWWIVAVSSLILGFLGGFCLQILSAENTQYESVQVLTFIGFFFIIFGLFLLPLFTTILVLIRFYKNFFTDEGYLTFTLPVKKTALLDSKLATYFLFSFASTLILVLNICIMLLIGVPESIFIPELWQGLLEGITFCWEGLGFYCIIYGILICLLLIALSVLQTLFLFLCITLAAVIAKKHKILLAIGIYYGANFLVAIAMEFIMFGGMISFSTMLYTLEEHMISLCVTFLLLALTGIVSSFAAVLYTIELYLLDRRLNLE